MLKQLFAEMNEMLSEVVEQYPHAVGKQKHELDDKLRILKSMSDTVIEEWLLFEEKLSAIHEQQPKVQVAQKELELNALRSEGFIRGQGYYKLQMYNEAIQQFLAIIPLHCEFMQPRLFLAMCYWQLGQLSESYSQFKLLMQLTEDRRIQAISCTLMGCIQLKKANPDQAIQYFKQAFQADPSSVEPLLEIGLCRDKKGKLDFRHVQRV